MAKPDQSMSEDDDVMIVYDDRALNMSNNVSARFENSAMQNGNERGLQHKHENQEDVGRVYYLF
jgi:hypothetical protein